MRSLRSFLVLGAFFAFTLPLMPFQLLLLATGSRYARTFPHWYHRQVCRIVGIRLKIDGEVAEEQGVLLISNHVSWIDITVLSAVAPVSFVAKQEVASWPFVKVVSPSISYKSSTRACRHLAIFHRIDCGMPDAPFS